MAVMCLDGVPVISEVDEVPGLILACGFTGHGFGTAPAVGLMLSQMVAGEDTIVDISSLAMTDLRLSGRQRMNHGCILLAEKFCGVR